ncbi:hypothetical protein GCWB2_00265 [Gordonia rubripertincta]|nr:hypothetical protein GCWB2_00265 [Gordonia rubripertincta]
MFAPVSRNSSKPPADDAAMPMASVRRSASAPYRSPAATAPASGPTTAVAWRPRAWKPCGAAAPSRQAISRPATSAVTVCAPVAPTSSATARTAGATTVVGCTSAPACVSSKSRACIRTPLAKAAAGAEMASGSPRGCACGGPPSPRATDNPGPPWSSRRAPIALPIPSSRCRNAARRVTSGMSSISRPAAQVTSRRAVTVWPVRSNRRHRRRRDRGRPLRCSPAVPSPRRSSRCGAVPDDTPWARCRNAPVR